MTTYRSEIEGLRAVAVLPVIFFHYGLGFPGGFVGVDIFFVISGFLITSLLIERNSEIAISLPNFWERRVRRIFPGLAVMIIACTVAGWWILLPEDYMRFARSLVSQMYFGSNFYFYLHTGYFEAAADTQPLLHTWTLAVEEQFYLFFPLLLILVRRVRLPMRTTLACLAGISLCLSVFLTQKRPAASFYLLHTRAWELLIGSLLATANAARIPRPIAAIAGFLGLLSIATAVFLFNGKTIFPGAAAFIPCAGAALIILGQGSPQTIVTRFLSLPPLTFIGRLSYSLYLWHWPAIVFCRYWAVEPLSVPVRLALLAAIFAISWASWKFVETPFRRRKICGERKSLFGAAAISTACLIGAGLVIANLRGVGTRFPAPIHHYLDVTREWKLPHNRELTLTQVKSGAFFEIGATDSSGPATFLLWGDSHAMSVIPVLERIAREHGIRGFAATHAAAPPLLDFYCANRTGGLGQETIPYNDAILAQIERQKIRNVLLVGYWSFYQSDAFTAEHGPLDGPEAARAFDDAAARTIKSLRDLGCRVWVMIEVPDQHFDVPKILARASLRGEDPQRIGRSTADYLSEMQRYRELFTRCGATMLAPEIALTNSVGHCRIQSNADCLYRDNSHLSIAGAMLLQPMFEPMFGEFK